MVKIKLILILFLSFFQAYSGDSGSHDPFRSLSYSKAFRQDDLYNKYRDVLVGLGCSENIFKEGDEKEFGSDKKCRLKFNCIRKPKYLPIQQEPKTLEDFRRECLFRLQSERRSSILRPAKEAATMIGLMAGGAGATMLASGRDSFGGSFSVFALMFNTVSYFRDAMRAAADLANPPARPLLDTLERRFACDKCFIPRCLWTVIENKFCMARFNDFTQQDSLNFLEFAVDLTLNKERKRKIIDVNVVSDELFNRIDSFLSKYDFDVKKMAALKFNLRNFLIQLSDDNLQKASRPQYFVGLPGIGKTHFVECLVKWIDELIPNSVYFENVVIGSVDELEGNSSRPGIMLRLLRNQLKAGTSGVVAMMDEATWMNSQDYISSSKRVFNGDLTQLSTSFLGVDSDGKGLTVPMPPMLVFVASNEPIQDTALKSRFDQHEFPAPKRESLVEYACRLAQESNHRLGDKFESALAELKVLVNDDKDIKSFRDVQSKVGPFLLQKYLDLKQK